MAATEILIVVELAALLLLYAAGLARISRRGGGRDPHRLARMLAFCAGLVAIAVALIPLDRAAESSIAAHMVQHLVLVLIAPPLLLAGAPHRVALGALPSLRRPLSRTLRSRTLRVLTHPAVALTLFAATLLLWHLPAIYDAALRGPALHGIEHVALLLAGLLLWQPVLGALPRPHRLSALSGFLYLMVAMLPGALIGLRLMTAGDPIYGYYAERGMSIASQHEAGMIMWGAGGLILAAAAVAVGWIAIERDERRRRRGARLARSTMMLLCAIGAITIGVSRADRSAAQPAVGPAPDPEVERGRALFEEGCSDCHGIDARGIQGRGPSLFGAGEGAADFYLRTGRMPLDDPGMQPERSESPYDESEIDALVAYIGTLGDGPGIPIVDPAEGDLAEGQRLFTELCAGCHQVVAQGGIMTGAVVPDLQQAEPVDVAEALETGPYVMPRFRRLESSEVDSLARYVTYTRDPEDRGGWGIGHIGPIPEGMVAWLLAGAALLLAIRLIGERTTR